MEVKLVAFNRGRRKAWWELLRAGEASGGEAPEGKSPLGESLEPTAGAVSEAPQPYGRPEQVLPGQRQAAEQITDQIRARLAAIPAPLDSRASLLTPTPPVDAASAASGPSAAPARTSDPAGRERGGAERPSARFSAIVVPRSPTGDLILAVRYYVGIRKWRLEWPQLRDVEEEAGWRDPAEACLASCGLEAHGKLSVVAALSEDGPGARGSLIVVVADGCRLNPTLIATHEPCCGGALHVAPEVLERLAHEGIVECVRTLAAFTICRRLFDEAR